MATIKPYEKRGQKLYTLKAFLGIDPLTGKKKSVSRSGFKTKKAAKLKLSELQLQFDEQGLTPQEKNKKITFKDVYKNWYESYINTVRTSTYARTNAMFENHILPEFGNRLIKTISIDDIQRAVNKWFKIAPKRNYKRWYQYTTNVFDFAIKRGYLSGMNPAKAVTLPKKEIKAGDKVQNFWDKDQLKEFFKYLENDNNFEKTVLFRVLAYTGIRRGECLALQWNDINIDKKTLHVNKTLTQGLRGETIVQPPKTNAGYRTIQLDDKTTNILFKWKHAMMEYYFSLGRKFPADQVVFAGRGKSKYHSLNTPAKWLSKVINKYNLKHITVHGFRKSYCTALVSAGLPLKEVQRRMGHDDVRTTLDVYSFVTKKQIDESTKMFEKYMEN